MPVATTIPGITGTRRLRAFLWVPLCGVLWLLAACTAVSFDNGKDRPPTLTESTYRAADMLSQQTQGQITRATVINVGSIADINKPAAVTAFGRTVASQLAARFVQLGYHVSASSYEEMNGGAPAAALAQSSSPYGGSSSPYGNGGAQAPASVTLTGQYAVAKREILVNLRFLDTGSAKVVAAYDYSLPLDADLRQLTKIESEDKGLLGF